MSKSLKNKVKLNDVVSVTDFGAVGDGVTDDSNAINAGLTYVKTFGKVLILGPNTYKCKNLRLEGGTKPWAMRGQGMYLTRLEHLDGAGNFLTGTGGTTVPYVLSDFTVDCKYSVYASASANNAISITNSSNIRIERVRCIDFKAAGILFSGTVPNVYTNNVCIDCVTENSPDGDVGMIIANAENSGFIRCRAIGGNKSGSPGFGIQFKNDCRFGYMTDCFVEGWNCAYAAGWTGSEYTQNATVSHCKGLNCNSLINGKWINSVIDVIGDNVSSGQAGVDITDPSIGNNISVSLEGLAAARGAVRFRAGCSYNTATIRIMDGSGLSARAVIFDDTATNNQVILDAYTNAATVYEVEELATFTTPADANGFTLRRYVMWEGLTIASGVVSNSNTASTSFRVETEASAASDDLNTLTHVGAVEGTSITLRTVNDSRDVVVKHGTGNIYLRSGLDYTLGNNNDTLMLRWSSASSAWFEIARSNNVVPTDPLVQTFTISAGGAVTMPRQYRSILVDTAGGGATDDLASINRTDALDGDLITVRALDDTHSVVVKHNTGNILLTGGVDFTLDAAADVLFLLWDAALTKWVEVSRSSNA